MHNNITKQDIMLSKIHSLFYIIAKTYYISLKKYFLSKMQNKEIINYLFFSNFLKSYGVIANIFYDGYLDINRLSETDFYQCLKDGAFTVGYLSVVTNINDLSKLLLFNAVTTNENGNLYDRVIKKVIEEQKTLNDAYYAVIDELTSDQINCLKLISNPDFTYKDLDSETLNMLNKYHQSFMNKEIIPFVTKDLDSKESATESIRVLKKIPFANINIDLPISNKRRVL